MDLILWRHAEAADGAPDLDRPLTAHGRAQAKAMAAWLEGRLPKKLRILVSPARRAQETAQALDRPFKTVGEIAPGVDARSLIEVSGWPDDEWSVLLVGHQPTLGEAVSTLMSGREATWRFAKGAIWWLRSRPRRTRIEAVLVLTIEPAMLEPGRGEGR